MRLAAYPLVCSHMRCVILWSESICAACGQVTGGFHLVPCLGKDTTANKRRITNGFCFCFLQNSACGINNVIFRRRDANYVKYFLLFTCYMINEKNRGVLNFLYFYYTFFLVPIGYLTTRGYDCLYTTPIMCCSVVYIYSISMELCSRSTLADLGAFIRPLAFMPTARHRAIVSHVVWQLGDSSPQLLGG